MLRQGLENFSNVLSSLSTSLDVVRELLISRECERLVVGDFARFLHICKVADKVDDNWRGRMVSNLSQPLILDVLKATALRDVEDKEHAVAALIEISRNRSERLLAGRIPNL